MNNIQLEEFKLQPSTSNLETMTALLFGYQEYIANFDNKFNRTKYLKGNGIILKKNEIDYSKCDKICNICKENVTINADFTALLNFFSHCVNTKTPLEEIWLRILGNISFFLRESQQHDDHFMIAISNFIDLTLLYHDQLKIKLLSEPKVRLYISFLLLIELLNKFKNGGRKEIDICRLINIESLNNFYNKNSSKDIIQNSIVFTTQRLIILYNLTCYVHCLSAKDVMPASRRSNIQKIKTLINKLYNITNSDKLIHFGHSNSILKILDGILTHQDIFINDDASTNIQIREALKEIIWFICKYHLLFWSDSDIFPATENHAYKDDIFVSIEKFWSEELNISNKNDFSTHINSLIKLYAHFCHSSKNIDRRYRIEHHLGSMTKSEGALYAVKPYHREHAVHTIDVAMLGEILFKLKIPPQNNSTLTQYTKEKLKCEQHEILQLWHITAIFHDIAYPIELYKSISHQMQFLNTDSFNKLKESIDSSINKSLEDTYRIIEEICDSKYNGIDHGMLSSVFLCEITKSILESDYQTSNCPDSEARKKAEQMLVHPLKAISYHSNKKLHFKAEECIIGALLILIDEVQEWGRSRSNTRELSMAAIMKARSFKYIDPRTIKLCDNVTLSIEDDFWIFDIKYLPNEKGESNNIPIDILLSKLENFQRIDWEGIFPITIRLHFYKENNVSENNIFKSFQNDNECMISEDILTVDDNEIISQRKYPVCHSKDDKLDIFIINLDKLPGTGKPRFLKTSFSKIRDEYYNYRNEFHKTINQEW